MELHKRTSYDLRAHFPDLPAQLVCAARVKATEAVTSALTGAKKREQASPKRVAKAEKMGGEDSRLQTGQMPTEYHHTDSL